MTTYHLWQMLTGRTVSHALFTHFTPLPDTRSRDARRLIRTFFALVVVAVIGMITADIAQLYNLVRLENLARMVMLPGVILLTLLCVAVITFLPVFLLGGVVIAGQHVGALHRAGHGPLHDDLTRIIPGGHATLLQNLGAALYRHPSGFFGMGLSNATNLHLVASLGVATTYAALLELSLTIAYEPFSIPPGVRLLVHPQVVVLSALIVMMLSVEVRQQLVLNFVVGTLAIYILPGRSLSNAAARLLVLGVTLASYLVIWLIFTSRAPLEVLDTTHNPLSVITWGGEVWVGYGGVYIVRELIISGLWQAVRVRGQFTDVSLSDFANPHNK